MKITMHEFKTKGFVTIPYPDDLRLRINDAIQSWEIFCMLPEDVKKIFSTSNTFDGVGYELKGGAGQDPKENFDVALSARHWLETTPNTEDEKIAHRFIADATQLVDVIQPTITAFAKQLEETFALIGLYDEVCSGKEHFFIRFIHYFGSDAPGQQIAAAHPDQSGFTLHLFESTEGLQCLTPERTWLDMPVSDGETVVIPGMQTQYRSNGTIKALSHRVVSTEESAAHGRFSAVSFIQFKNTPKYDKDKNGRVQDREPGFNYDMSDETFKSLFAK